LSGNHVIRPMNSFKNIAMTNSGLDRFELSIGS